jgi:hypothetical protein
MVQLQGFGALLFGAVALAFIGALAVNFGGALEITLALAAMFAAYGSQWFSFNGAVLVDAGRAPEAQSLHAIAWWLQIGATASAAVSFIFSVWF